MVSARQDYHYLSRYSYIVRHCNQCYAIVAPPMLGKALHHYYVGYDPARLLNFVVIAFLQTYESSQGRYVSIIGITYLRSI